METVNTVLDYITLDTMSLAIGYIAITLFSAFCFVYLFCMVIDYLRKRFRIFPLLIEYMYFRKHFKKWYNTKLEKEAKQREEDIRRIEELENYNEEE